jgi:hypothetical protein
MMVARGYVRAVDAARGLGTHLSTVHRWAADDLVEHTRVGSALYVLVDSLVEMFKTANNTPMADAARKLKRK